MKDRYTESYKEFIKREERKEALKEIGWFILTVVVGIVFAFGYMLVMPD